MDLLDTAVDHFMAPVYDSNDNNGNEQLALNNRPDCPYCFDVFSTVEELRTHKRLHRINKQYICKLCSASFISVLGWQYHYKSHNVDLQHSCDSCNVKFKSFQQLVLHIENHQYFCSCCDKAFVRREQLRLHERKEHNITDGDYDTKKFDEHRCPKCDAKFRTHGLLRKHRKENQRCSPFSCHKCGKCFLSRIHLDSHTTHYKNCRKVFEKQKLRKFNMLIPTILIPRLQSMRIKEPKSYVCNNCDLSFARIKLRHEHWIRHKDCRPYGCSHCNARFVNKEDIEVHVRYHMYKCLRCLRRFVNKSEFDDHRCTVKMDNDGEMEISKEKNFECLYCCETYSTEQQLQDHIDYVGENLFVCSKCFEPFCNQCTFGYHLMIDHDVDKSHISSLVRQRCVQ